MKKIFTILIVILIGSELFAQQKISEIAPINKERPADFEYLSAPDSTGHRTLRKVPSITLNKTQSMIKLPYPILFVHGLNSYCSTWDVFTNYLDATYGLTFGGNIDYCLNFDGSNYTTNKNFYPTAGADIALYTPTTSLVVGDYYYINFDVGINGSFHPNGNAADVISNQSAISKQGLAIAYAIQTILQMTGKDKVILMGHSMGGLASREYLQNWTQSDGFHHIGKLATTGTPHGGSDQVTGGVLSGVDCQSEAYRDLRTTYSGSGNYGIYLFGGVEDNVVTDLSFCSDFYNVDANCNGTVNENIVGLNYKAIPQDLSYACAIGIGSNLGGDGCVGHLQANLNNYKTLTYPADTFVLDEPAIITTAWHVELPKLTEANVNLLDEPNEFALSYDIGYNTNYTAFITRQHVGGYLYDYDDYKFLVSSNSTVSVSINNIPLADLAVHIVDASGNTVGSIVHSNGTSSISYSQNLNAGYYYLEIYGTPTTTSYLYPYNFILNSSTVNGISEISSETNFLIYPNPASDLITIKTSNFSALGSSYTINDQLGRQVLNGKLTDNTTNIDINNLPKGFYLIQISKSNKQTFKFIKE